MEDEIYVTNKTNVLVIFSLNAFVELWWKSMTIVGNYIFKKMGVL